MQQTPISIDGEHMFETITQYFKGAEIAVTEILQNAYRAVSAQIEQGACPTIMIHMMEEDCVFVQDPGKGIKDVGAALSLAASQWQAEVQQTQRPAGLGLCGLLANCDKVRIQSQFGSLLIHSEQFFNSSDYRARLLDDIDLTGALLYGTEISMIGIHQPTQFRIHMAEAVRWFTGVKFDIHGFKPAEDPYKNLIELGEVEGLAVYLHDKTSITSTRTVHEPYVVTIWHGQRIGPSVSYQDTLYVVADPKHAAPEGFAPLLPTRHAMAKTDKFDQVLKAVIALYDEHVASVGLNAFDIMLKLKNSETTTLLPVKHLYANHVSAAKRILEKRGYLGVLPVESNNPEKRCRPQYRKFDSENPLWSLDQSMDVLVKDEVIMSALEEYSGFKYFDWEGLPSSLVHAGSVLRGTLSPLPVVSFQLHVAESDVTYPFHLTGPVLASNHIESAKLQLVEQVDDNAVIVRFEDPAPTFVWYGEDGDDEFYAVGKDKDALRYMVDEMAGLIITHYKMHASDSEQSDVRSTIKYAHSTIMEQLGGALWFDIEAADLPVPYGKEDRIIIDQSTQTITIESEGKDPVTYNYK
jgi:hypothetical protein